MLQMELIQPISTLKISKMSKKYIYGEKLLESMDYLLQMHWEQAALF